MEPTLCDDQIGDSRKRETPEAPSSPSSHEPVQKVQRCVNGETVESSAVGAPTAGLTFGDLKGPRDERDRGRGRASRRQRGSRWYENRRERKPRKSEDGRDDEDPQQSGSSIQAGGSEGQKPHRFPKRKVGILFGYSGKGYQGLQKNPGAKTIEDELEKALLLVGCIPADAAGNLQKLQWQRCARTDKGVGALFQLISLKITLPWPVEELPEKINAYLPWQIRVFCVERVSKGFSSKNACNARTYEYMLPTSCLFREPGQQFTEASRARVQAILDKFVGSHKFHNFTSGRPWWHESSRRTIFTYTCSAPFSIDGVEFVTLTVKGNSFVLHHIRKMTALIVCVFRDNAPLEVVEASFQPHPVYIPMAPAAGLVLRQCHFDLFFKDRAVAHLKKLDFPEHQHLIEAFKLNILMPEIVEQLRDGTEFNEWLKVIAGFPIPYQEVIEASLQPPPPLPS
ncbi:MAG: tRNA pseudouridine(38-40) synthase TruA, partial [archaeon]|nr:tRNA pseudouridine(38-40) synthase TruA [archaeon]